ncbi:hypothetical protein FQZ97_709430 [compost metagenome]
MRHRRRNCHQQTGRRRQRRSQAAGSHQSDHPVGQQRDFRVGQHDDVGVHGQFVALPAGRFGLAFGDFVLGGVVVVLDAAVGVLVFPLQQAGFFPALHPVGTLFVDQAVFGGVQVAIGFHHVRVHDDAAVGTLGQTHSGVHGAMQVQLGHGAHGRSRGVQQSNEDQRPASRCAGVGHLRHGEEANDHVRQTGRTDHQRHRVEEHVQHRTGAGAGVLAKAQIGHHLVQLGQQRHIGTRHVGTQAQLRQEVAGQVQGDEEGGDQVGADQHDVLGHLGVGDALHATEHGVGEHDGHTDVDALLARHAQEAREGHAHTRHLTNDVGQRGHQQAQHRDVAGGLRVEAVADELGHGELAELAQVRRQQHGQQHVATGPTHQEHGAAVAHVGDQAGHGDEGRGRHPVSGRGHAVGHGVHPAAGDVELGRAARACPEGDAEVKREAEPDEQIDGGLKCHLGLPWSVFLHAELAVDLAHLVRVPED